MNSFGTTGLQAIRAVVPLAEMFGYATDLRSRTHQQTGEHSLLNACFNRPNEFFRHHAAHNLVLKGKAGSLAFKDGCAKASPVLLEPVFKVEVVVPEDYMGEVMGNVSSRRGRIEGMEGPSGNGRCQCGLAVVNVTNRADINMRLCAFKLLFCHLSW